MDKTDKMSRTDIHRPLWVMETDPTIRHWFRDFHHHPDGICDLDDYLSMSPFELRRTNCYRQVWTQAPNICGCLMCTWGFGRKVRRKQERRKANMMCREIAKLDDFSDVDFPQIVGSSW